MTRGHTPLPWAAHGAFYAHGVKGDVFAKDAQDVFNATPICRVVRPLSHRAIKAEKTVIDAIQAIGRRKDEAPVIEANAAFIVRACNSHYELLEALTEIAELGSDGEHSGDRHARCRAIARAAIAKAAAA